MQVLKFGGTSVGSAEMFERVGRIIHSRAIEEQITIVVSAMTGITDLLESIGRLSREGKIAEAEVAVLRERHMDVISKLLHNTETRTRLTAIVDRFSLEIEDIITGVSLIRDITPKVEARLLSIGELLSSQILTAYLGELNEDVCWLDSRDVIVTSGKFRGGNVLEEESYQRIRSALKSSTRVTVLPGFVARNSAGEPTVLGRGGSDYSAALIATALNAVALVIWSDVDGMMSADPRIVPSAVPVAELTYDEAMELSHFGAKVIYPPTIRPVLQAGIPILIKNTFQPEAPGTFIARDVIGGAAPLRGISHIPDIALITISGTGMIGVPGTAMRLFKALYEGDINVLFITQSSSEHSITVGVGEAVADTALRMLEKEFAVEMQNAAIEPLQTDDGLSLVAAVGENMRHRPGIAGKLFSLLGENAVNIRAIAQGSTERNVSFVIQQKDIVKALNVIHEGFFLSPARVVHLYVIGVGNVGGEFLDQLAGQKPHLLDTYHIDFRLAGIANSRVMKFDEHGIDISGWQTALATSKETFSPRAFIAQLGKLNLRNTIFIDNTASPEIAELYSELLSVGAHIVTSNKIAASSGYLEYNQLKDRAIRQGVQFLFETNVAAGLPVIRTMRDLLLTGDRIHKIQAVLSGTMNFIFNTLSDAIPFSQAVAMAKEMKYTEPDPAIDLSGLDVRRKALILARESGIALELDDVKTEPFLDPELLVAGSWESLFVQLKEADAEIGARVKKAEGQGKRLRFLAEIDHGTAKVGLQEVDATHPAYTLSGSDNLVLLYTDRYRELPLVIRGAGAGPAVTASGVLADVLRIVNV